MVLVHQLLYLIFGIIKIIAILNHLNLYFIKKILSSNHIIWRLYLTNYKLSKFYISSLPFLLSYLSINPSIFAIKQPKWTISSLKYSFNCFTFNPTHNNQYQNWVYLISLMNWNNEDDELQRSYLNLITCHASTRAISYHTIP